MFDIETVPDIDMARRWLHLDPMVPPTEVVDLMQNAHPNLPMPKLAFHQIVAIAGALVDDTGTLVHLKALGQESVTESVLVQQFFDVVDRYHARLVGWNTSGFDLPCLIYRAIRHRLPIPHFYRQKGYRYRYNEEHHLDLMDLLSAYGATVRVSLDEMAALVGIPGKLSLAGQDVWPLFLSGNLSAIRTYCETDVMTTTLIFAHYAYHRGWMDQEQRDKLIHGAAQFLEQRRDDPHWRAYREAWTDS